MILRLSFAGVVDVEGKAQELALCNRVADLETREMLLERREHHMVAAVHTTTSQALLG